MCLFTVPPSIRSTNIVLSGARNSYVSTQIVVSATSGLSLSGGVLRYTPSNNIFLRKIWNIVHFSYSCLNQCRWAVRTSHPSWVRIPPPNSLLKPQMSSFFVNIWLIWWMERQLLWVASNLLPKRVVCTLYNVSINCDLWVIYIFYLAQIQLKIIQLLF